ncbi:uncharacterized protein B0T23DRAFT_309431 [Neurospora hispaniola]|uniref:Uncharacterized protein n=1 Tax=Neurospora hispaniola TaxID=588809 RepID=A0AAJ0ID21_9PEZI|nr:hypothetical protein NEUTE2DRAFT_161629 [Neurospora tetrasperma FGSC 2509]KAK3497473.1 hypothetical protein B0T23DRAFT_309431 [Neurospora hispaniola]
MAAPDQPVYVINYYHLPFGLVELDGHQNFEMWDTALRQYLRAASLLHHLVLDEMSPEQRECDTCRDNWNVERGRVLCLIDLTLGNRLVREALYEHGWQDNHPSPTYHYDMVIGIWGPAVQGWA